MVHLESGISFQECELVFGKGSPICDAYRHATVETQIIFSVYNPFKKDLNPVAESISNAVKALIPTWNTSTQSEFEFTTFGIRDNKQTNGQVIIFMREFGDQPRVAPILAVIAVFIAIFIGFQVFMGWVRVVETIQATKQATIALENKQLDAQIIDQFNQCQEMGKCTVEEVLELIKATFPNGIGDDPDDQSSAVDTNIFGDFTKQITGAINIIIPLAILGAVIAVVPRRGR